MSITRRFLVTFALLAGAVVACSSSEAPSQRGEPGDLSSLRLAVQGGTDERLDRSLLLLADGLDARDWSYLLHAHWPNDDGSAALDDPTLRKAALALVVPSVSSGVGTRGLGIRTFSAHQIEINREQWQRLYPQAVLVMPHGYTSTPRVATAWAQLLAGMFLASPGSPLPDPRVAADGKIDGCGKSFYEGGATPPDCDISDFCCNGELDFALNASTCLDVTSCRDKKSPPGKMKIKGGDAGASSNELQPVGDCDEFHTEKTGKPPPVSDPGCLLNCGMSFKDSCSGSKCFVYDTAGLTDAERTSRLPKTVTHCFLTPWYDAPQIPDTFVACCVSQ